MGNISIFAGGFGSGKTEITLNFAINRAAESNRVILADLDVVNPYFVSREVKPELQEKGIRLLAPGGQLSFGDVPNLPAEIIGLIKQDNDMFIDLAGDEAGALVLGYLSKYITGRYNYNLYLILNPYRPFASDLQNVMELKARLERASRIKFTGIISNPNLVEETDINIIEDGHRRVVGFAESLNIPVKFLTVEEKFYQQLLPEYGNELKKIKLYLRPDWLQGCWGGLQDGKG